MLQQQQPAFIISWEFISWKHGRGAKCGFRVSSLFSTAQKKVNVIFGGICCDVSLAGVTVVQTGAEASSGNLCGFFIFHVQIYTES